MTDRFTVRMVVAFLGVIVLAGILMGGGLAYQEKPVPDFLIGTTAGSLGGLTGILVRLPADGAPIVERFGDAGRAVLGMVVGGLFGLLVALLLGAL